MRTRWCAALAGAALIALLPMTIAAQGKQSHGEGKRGQHGQGQGQGQAQRPGGGGGGGGQGPVARFDQLDTNKDGKLTAAEGASVRWFSQADANKDNIVTKAEVTAFAQNRAGAAGRQGARGPAAPGQGRAPGQFGGMKRPDGQTSGAAAMMLMNADTDKDGKISYDEFKSWPRSETMPDMFSNADGDKDGYLTSAEIQAEMAARRKAGFAPRQSGSGPGRGWGKAHGDTTGTAPLAPAPPQ